MVLNELSPTIALPFDFTICDLSRKEEMFAEGKP
jgi:hypothetical protein